ncbi:hypothetical protein D9M69_585320 [compost metagenome]
MFTVHGVPGGVLQAGIDALVAGHQAHVHFLHQLGGDQASAGVAGGGHDVVATRFHQRHHFVGRGCGLDVDLAARCLFKAGGPVVGLVGFTAFDVARPGNDVELSLALANGLGRGCEAGCGGGNRQQTKQNCAGLGHRNS